MAVSVFHFSHWRFQSTLPSRGATKVWQRPDGHTYVSIHTPSVRSNTYVLFDETAKLHFNPRSPYGRAFALFSVHVGRLPFQSSLPPWEQHGKISPVPNTFHFNPRPHTGSNCLSWASTPPTCYFNPRSPVWGATWPSVCFISLIGDFNPHSPYGEQPHQFFVLRKDTLFQSTLPTRGATELLLHLDLSKIFQSTLPTRGATILKPLVVDGIKNFNPRSPHGEQQRYNVVFHTAILYFVSFHKGMR